MRAFHVPKTVDNDLLVTDHCPGYGSAAKFVACALIGDDLDNRALPGVKIDVIMGRNAGFLTAAAALGRKRDDDGPHLLYLPERPVSIGKFLGDVEDVYKKLRPGGDRRQRRHLRRRRRDLGQEDRPERRRRTRTAISSFPAPGPWPTSWPPR